MRLGSEVYHITFHHISSSTFILVVSQKTLDPWLTTQFRQLCGSMGPQVVATPGVMSSLCIEAGIQ